MSLSRLSRCPLRQKRDKRDFVTPVTLVTLSGKGQAMIAPKTPAATLPPAVELLGPAPEGEPWCDLCRGEGGVLRLRQRIGGQVFHLHAACADRVWPPGAARPRASL